MKRGSRAESLTFRSIVHRSKDLIARLHHEHHDNVPQPQDPTLILKPERVVYTVRFAPTDTLYADDLFNLEVTVNADSYPANPPSVKFLTPICHPNISKSGLVSFRWKKGEWNGERNGVEDVLKTLVILLWLPNLKVVVRPDVAALFTRDQSAYEKKTREETESQTPGKDYRHDGGA